MNAFKWTGIWWLPNQPENKLCGMLSFDSEGQILLELTGAFDNIKDMIGFGREEIILGVCSQGKVVTLNGCQRAGFQLTQPGLFTSRYFVQYVLIGWQFPSEESIVFDSLAVHYEHLHAWSGITGFNWEISPVGKEGPVEKVSYEFPIEKEVVVIDLNMGLHHSYISEGDRVQTVSLRQITFWKIAHDPPLNFKVLLDHFRYVQRFLSLAMDCPTYPIKIIGKAASAKTIMSDGTEYHGEIEILFSFRRGHSARESVGSHEMLFCLSDISDCFQQCLENWFQKANQLDPVCELFFGTMFSSSMYLQQEFLSLSQALESYHRRTRSGEYVAPSTFEPIYDHLVKAIPADLEDGFRESMKAKFKYLAEYSLRRRLDDLFDDLLDLLPAGSKKQDVLIADIVATRNYLTHFDALLENSSKKGQELYDLIQTIRQVIQVALLIELGIPRDRVHGLMKKHALVK